MYTNVPINTLHFNSMHTNDAAGRRRRPSPAHAEFFKVNYPDALARSSTQIHTHVHEPFAYNNSMSSVDVCASTHPMNAALCRMARKDYWSLIEREWKIHWWWCSDCDCCDPIKSYELEYEKFHSFILYPSTTANEKTRKSIESYSFCRCAWDSETTLRRCSMRNSFIYVYRYHIYGWAIWCRNGIVPYRVDYCDCRVIIVKTIRHPFSGPFRNGRYSSVHIVFGIYDWLFDIFVNFVGWRSLLVGGQLLVIDIRVLSAWLANEMQPAMCFLLSLSSFYSPNGVGVADDCSFLLFCLRVRTSNRVGVQKNVISDSTTGWFFFWGEWCCWEMCVGCEINRAHVRVRVLHTLWNSRRCCKTICTVEIKHDSSKERMMHIFCSALLARSDLYRRHMEIKMLDIWV